MDQMHAKAASINRVPTNKRSKVLLMSVELWKGIFDWAAVVLVGLTFIAGAGALITGRILSHREEERLRQFDSELTGAKNELVKQQGQTAQVEVALEAQKERTAKAEKDASDAALALAKFKQPRTISPEQRQKLVADVKPFARTKFAMAVFPAPEPLALARNLDVLLKSAHWERVPSQIQRDGGVLIDVAGQSAAEISDSGIDLYIAPDDNESVNAQHALCSALIAAGIACETHRTPQLAGKMPRAITVSVGKKP
jgi:hypothetical protein